MFSKMPLLRLLPTRMSRKLSSRAAKVLSSLEFPGSLEEMPGVYDGTWRGSGELITSVCPTTGEALANIRTASPAETQAAIQNSRQAYLHFRDIPGPKRGEILRQVREAIAEKKDELGALVTLEMGKIRTEGVGEVQEIIDICDYAVGLSRLMNGTVLSSERPGHTILEVPNPLGLVAILSAFNFPVAVYGWNLSLALAAGNATIWKPSPTTSLCSIALTYLITKVLEKNGISGAVASLVTGDRNTGAELVNSRSVDLVSFTGSEAVGRTIGQTVASRFGKSILELGGNNAAIVMSDADLRLAIPSIFFGAIGTAGQRCTSTRRLFLHRSIASDFLSRLQNLYASIRPGDPLNANTTYGPLHSKSSMNTFEMAIAHLQANNVELITGGSKYEHSPFSAGNFVQPTIAIPRVMNISDIFWQTETFAPILHVAVFDHLEEAIHWNNAVPQGLSSSLWTRDIRNIGKWLGPSGSDTGIANVNASTSGAEIGAAFGGNKSTGWGRESGGDAWKQYVRWSACTVNFSNEAPLAQGVQFSE